MQNTFIISITAAFLSQTTSAVTVDHNNNDIDLYAMQFGQVEQNNCMDYESDNDTFYNDHIYATCNWFYPIDKVKCEWRGQKQLS